jgi:carbohydrate kinase (thermoresistant glucokinase family)
MIIVVMGVSGCGKSTIGKRLAERLSLPFIEADDFHSKENIAKMSQGIPLTDEDRYPWLQSLSQELKNYEEKKGAVLACSALKESYRKILQKGLKKKITWIYLEGDEKTLRKRIEHRKGHFMPEELLLSQLKTLEKPSNAYTFSIKKNPKTIVDEIMNTLQKK